MNTFKKIDLHKLRNYEFFQFFVQFLRLVEEFGTEALKIKAVFEKFLLLFGQLDKALEVISKSDITPQIAEVDHRRDTTYKGFAEAVKSASKHFKPEMAEAARKLQIVIDHFGDFTKLPYNEETGKIYNLVQELQNEKYSPLVSMLNLTEWVNELVAINIEFDTLIKNRFDERLEKQELRVKAIRKEVEESYKEIAGDIEALCRVHKTEIYIDFINKLNIQITYYNNILLQRKGRAEKQKEQQPESSTAKIFE